MTLVKWAKNRIENNRRSRRGISTIMANLTMLVIVVVLSSMLFIWAVSSFGAYQGGAGYWFSSRSIANQERISVEGVFFCTQSNNNYAQVFVRNVGTIPFTVASVYINSTLYQSPLQFSPIQVNVTQVAPIGLATGPTCGTALAMTAMGQSFVRGDVQTITVATLRGTVITTTWVA